MNTKTSIVIAAIAAVTVLFASGSLTATQAQAFGGFHRGVGFHHFPFHHFHHFHHFAFSN